MSDFAHFRRVAKEHGLAAALIKTLARAGRKRVLIEGLDEDFPRPPPRRDLSMPTQDDAELWHLGYGGRTKRYNPAETLTCETARFPAAGGDVDLIYAASLFTHLYPDDARAYVREMHRVLKVGGLAMVSFHDRPLVGERFSGTEHRADYETSYFAGLLTEAGFEMVEDIGDVCGQHTLVLRTVSKGAQARVAHAEAARKKQGLGRLEAVIHQRPSARNRPEDGGIEVLHLIADERRA